MRSCDHERSTSESHGTCTTPTAYTRDDSSASSAQLLKYPALSRVFPELALLRRCSSPIGARGLASTAMSIERWLACECAYDRRGVGVSRRRCGDGIAMSTEMLTARTGGDDGSGMEGTTDMPAASAACTARIRRRVRIARKIDTNGTNSRMRNLRGSSGTCTCGSEDKGASVSISSRTYETDSGYMNAGVSGAWHGQG